MKEYRRPMEPTWWLQKRVYRLFMLREWTSVFVGGYSIFLLVMAVRAGDRGSFAEFYAMLQSPWSIALHAVTLLMVLYHTVTWLNLTPKVLVLWRGEQRVSPLVIVGAHYAGWLVVSVVVAWIALR